MWFGIFCAPQRTDDFTAGVRPRFWIFHANNLLIAKLQTLSRLNKSKLSGLVNMFTVVLPLVDWWWWWCSLFLHKCTTVRQSTMQVAAAAAAVAAVDDRRAAAFDGDGGGGYG